MTTFGAAKGRSSTSAASQAMSCRSEATLPAYGWGGFSPSSHVSPKAPNRSEQGTGMPSLASTACTWSLADDRIRTSLSRYRVSSRSSRTCGGANPRLRQPAQPQQVGQVGAVPLVVLDPPVGERLDPQRVGQVHLRPGGRQRVRRPVPAVGGLDHHPRVRPGPRHDRGAALRGCCRCGRSRACARPRSSAPARCGAGAGPSRRPAGRRMIPSLRASLPGGDGCFATSSIRQERRPAPSWHQSATRVRVRRATSGETWGRRHLVWLCFLNLLIYQRRFTWPFASPTSRRC